MAVFAGLVVLFLQRSISEEAVDSVYQYAPPAIGCAAANYVGNLGLSSNRMELQLFAGVILSASVIYIFHILRPLPFNKDRP
jgi:Na+/H+-dicarboxylate symporter